MYGKLWAGHVALFLLSDIQHLLGLWLPPLAETHQTGRKPILLYNFSRIRLNDQVNQVAPKELIRFGQSLHRLLDCILEAYMALGLEYLSKVDLNDVYMCILVRLADILSVAFLIPKDT